MWPSMQDALAPLVFRVDDALQLACDRLGTGDAGLEGLTGGLLCHG